MGHGNHERSIGSAIGLLKLKNMAGLVSHGTIIESNGVTNNKNHFPFHVDRWIEYLRTVPEERPSLEEKSQMQVRKLAVLPFFDVIKHMFWVHQCFVDFPWLARYILAPPLTFERLITTRKRNFRPSDRDIYTLVWHTFRTWCATLSMWNSFRSWCWAGQ